MRPFHRFMFVSATATSLAVTRTTAAFLSVLAALAWPGAPLAAEYPTRPVRLLVPFPPGGAGDYQARAFGPQLAEQLRQQLVIDNRGGANGAVAHEIVAKAAPDGYTLLLGFMSALTINPALYPKLSYDPVKDFAPITMVSDAPMLYLAKAAAPFNNFKELIAAAKAKPNTITFGSAGNGTGTHLAFAEFVARAGLDMVHVPYKGGPEALTSVISGTTCCIFNQVQTVLPQYKAGKVRLLGVTTAKPVAAIKEVPTIASSGIPGTKGFDSSIWFGIFAPKGTPPAIVDKLSNALKTALKEPDVMKRFNDISTTPVPESRATPNAAQSTLTSEIDRWAPIIKAANIKPE